VRYVLAVSTLAENVGSVGYGDAMTAEPLGPNDLPAVPSFPPGTTPEAIRDALIDEERADFEQAYERAMIKAIRTMDLTPVLDVLRTYHRIAVMTQRQGATAHRRMLDQIAHALDTGEAPAGSVSDEEMIARINARLDR
jgi:hypothetical protein